MKRRHRVAAVVLIGATVLCSGVVRASAQDAPPDLRMLMNLDLFEPRHNTAQVAPSAGSSPADDSMLDQIRTLDAMGYLGDHGADGTGAAPAPRATAEAPESASPTGESATGANSDPSAPASQPSYDAEGPSP